MQKWQRPWAWWESLRGRWAVLQNRVLALQALASERANEVGAYTKFVRMASQSLILGLGAWLVLNDAITGGAMIAGSILLGRALAPVEQAIGHWRGYVSAQSAHARLRELFDDYAPNVQEMALPRTTRCHCH